MRSPGRVFWSLVSVVLLADCASKLAIEDAIPAAGGSKPVVDHILQFTLAYNQGAAFSTGLGANQRWVLIGVVIAVLLCLARSYRQITKRGLAATVGLALVVGGAGGCRDNPTGPSVADLQAAQANWATHHLTRYAYRYMTTGFFNTLDGQAIRLVVLADTVRSAQFVATNDSVPVVPATLPTVDALFTLAISASRAGTLVRVEFDPTFGYPTRLKLSGPPDAAGDIFASDIELLP